MSNYVHRPLDPKAAPKDAIVIELDSTPPAGRKPPPRVRTVPRAGFESNLAGGLAYFVFCPCGCEAYSVKPMPTCPQCHRAV